MPSQSLTRQEMDKWYRRTNDRCAGLSVPADPLSTLSLALLLAACADSDRPVAPTTPQGQVPLFTTGSGTASTPLGRGTFQAGGHSGWHSHPGPVFIQVLSGQMT